MHAVVTRVTINDREAATSHLRENVVPGVSQAPGFVAGYWARGDDGTGLAMVMFESEEAAKHTTLETVEVREVVAHA